MSPGRGEFDGQWEPVQGLNDSPDGSHVTVERRVDLAGSGEEELNTGSAPTIGSERADRIPLLAGYFQRGL